ncbi:MAG: hypothetical protein IKC91_01980 [Clostridia bacterium]|nr:hypothetical protein [Clostridia bacterium]
MKKLLSILMAIACLCSVILFTACDGSGNSSASNASSPSGSTASDSTNGGGDVSMPVNKVIKYVETEDFRRETERRVAVTNVEETTVNYDQSKMNDALINPENYGYLLSGAAYTTTDINEIYAVFDELYKESKYVSSEIFLIGFDFTGLENVEVSYELYLGELTLPENGAIGNSYFDREGVTYEPRFRITFSGEIEVADGSVYAFEGEYDTSSSMYDSDAQKTLVNNADEIIKDGLIINRVGYSGPTYTYVAYHLNYGDEFADGVNLGRVWIKILDGINTRDFFQEHISLEEYEAYEAMLHKTAGQFYEILKDRVVVYDYEHYSKQFDKK